MVSVGLERRDWNRRSKGRNDGDGLESPGLEARDGKILLPGEDMTDPYKPSVRSSRRG
jgi:hypothetical protein